MTRQEMDANLPGDPSKLLVSRVRKSLKQYGIQPARLGTWRMAWQWAANVMRSYAGAMAVVGTPRKKQWPGAGEVAAQYMALLLVEMKDGWALRLPHRAATCLPVEVAARVLASGITGIGGAAPPKPPALPAKE